MKRKFFKKRVLNLVKTYELLTERDLRLEKAFGGDTVISPIDVSRSIDNMVFDFCEELDDDFGIIEELIFEHLLSPSYNKKENKITLTDGKKIPATIKAVWKALT